MFGVRYSVFGVRWQTRRRGVAVTADGSDAVMEEWSGGHSSSGAATATCSVFAVRLLRNAVARKEHYALSRLARECTTKNVVCADSLTPLLFVKIRCGRQPHAAQRRTYSLQRRPSWPSQFRGEMPRLLCGNL
jgi:hypothetical protein